MIEISPQVGQMPNKVHAGSEQAIAAAERLLAGGRVHEAIDLLSDQNRRDRDPRIDEHLVMMRHHAFAQLDKTSTSAAQIVLGGAGGNVDLQSVSRDELSVERLREGFANDGCLLVRNLIDEAEAKELRRGIDRALDAFDEGNSAQPTLENGSWYTPFVVEDDKYRVGGRRRWMRESGGVWAVDSPVMFFELCELVDRTGIGEVITKHLGERPVLSANKCNLRRVPVSSATNWHQDGAFLGEEVRTVNFWLTLSDCGVDAPGLDVLPQRLEHVLETGTQGAIFDWSVGEGVVEALDSPVIRPNFTAGDALLFDQFFLHRTAVNEEMTKDRYAIESWFFAPSVFPEGQIPIVY
ncbi:MAG: phytanoyl-CoA dioxygenase family protein [Acidobacteria bacterium]|nr:phytanoyl-CoA dioxygenase family protein [Acidobacteriota bacterium]